MGMPGPFELIIILIIYLFLVASASRILVANLEEQLKALNPP